MPQQPHTHTVLSRLAYVSITMIATTSRHNPHRSKTKVCLWAETCGSAEKNTRDIVRSGQRTKQRAIRLWTTPPAHLRTQTNTHTYAHGKQEDVVQCALPTTFNHSHPSYIFELPPWTYLLQCIHVEPLTPFAADITRAVCINSTVAVTVPTPPTISSVNMYTAAQQTDSSFLGNLSIHVTPKGGPPSCEYVHA